MLLATLGIPLGATIGLVGAAAIAVGLVLLGVSAGRRRRQEAPRTLAPPGPMICPACGRELPPGTLFCPIDARALVAASLPAERRPSSLHCPRCHRAFDAATRFCPFDASDLARATPPSREHEGHDHALLLGSDKICPTCAAKYGQEASFCGRDGSQLHSVN